MGKEILLEGLPHCRREEWSLLHASPQGVVLPQAAGQSAPPSEGKDCDLPRMARTQVLHLECRITPPPFLNQTVRPTEAPQMRGVVVIGGAHKWMHRFGSFGRVLYRKRAAAAAVQPNCGVYLVLRNSHAVMETSTWAIPSIQDT